MNEASPFAEHFFSADDGLKLHARVYGAKNRERMPVMCLPALTRNCRDFHELALKLSSGQAPRKVVAVDYRGRGQSGYDRDWRNYEPQTEARDVATALTVLGIERAAFIGTSRGALVTMMLSAIRPAAIGAVVFNDAGPAIEGGGLARIRSQLERMPRPKTFEEAVTILRGSLAAPFPALLPDDWERMARAVFRQDKKGFVPDHDPKLLKTLQAIDLSQPIPVAWPQFHGLTAVPMLVIRGENSDILSLETLAEMKSRHRRLTTITVAGQGHPPMLETGDLPDRIAAFLAEAEAK